MPSFIIFFFLFQSSPKGPTIPYKAAAFPVPPPSSSTSPLQEPNPGPASSYASPPPCNPVHVEPLALMPPFFSPSPLMSPGYPVGPCVRYTAVPLSPSVYPLMSGPEPPKPVYCQAPLEASSSFLEVCIFFRSSNNASPFPVPT